MEDHHGIVSTPRILPHRAWALLLCLLPASLSPALYFAPPALPGPALAGDLIFRRGTEPVSAAVLVADGGQYSHVGMLLGEPGAWQVLHSTPSEVPGRADGVAVDSLAFFLNPARSSGYAVYQVEASAAQRQRAVDIALGELGKPFLVGDPAGTYCTLLVWHAWQQAGVDFEVAFTKMQLPLLSGHYLLPSQLRRSTRLQRLAHNPPAEQFPAESTPAENSPPITTQTHHHPASLGSARGGR